MSLVSEQPSMGNPRAVLHWYDFSCPFCYIGQSRNAVFVRHGFHLVELTFQRFTPKFQRAPPGHLCWYTRAMETTDMETATIKTPKSCSYMSSFTISGRSQLSGCDAQHDLAALVRRTSEHLVGRRASSSGSTVPTSVTSFRLSNSCVILSVWPFVRRKRQRLPAAPWMSTLCPAVTWA
jgi:hypothetical protein